jgi:hemolysin activation/secretion protein
VGLAAQLRRDDFVPVAGTQPVPRTVTGLAGVTFAAERADFAVVRNVGSILREEDVAVGPSIRLAAHASPRAFGYADDGVGLAGSARLGARVGRGYVSASASASARVAGGLDSGSVRVATTNALVPAARHALILHGQAGWQRNPVPGEEYDVGLGFGPRGFPLHAFTGDRLVLLAAEYRWTVAEEALGVLGLGVAAFGEWGGAWYAGSPRRTGGNAGVGVRWAFVRGAENGTRRVDLVRRFASDRLPAGWSLVVGEGFVF